MSEQSRQVLWIFTVTAISAAILCFAVNVDLPYEQDQGSKAAKILYLVKSGQEFSPVEGPEFYRDYLFSFYYIFMAVVYRFTGGDIIRFMNYSSVILGIVYFCTISILLRKTYNVDYLTSWIVFISIPIVVITFIYGNEAALSQVLFALSLLVFSYRFWGYTAIGALLFGLSIATRADMVLLLPFWLCWLINNCSSKPFDKDTLKYASQVISLLGVFLSAYWIIFLRESNFGSLTFQYDTNNKLLASYITYPFNISLIVIGKSRAGNLHKGPVNPTLVFFPFASIGILLV